MDQQQTTNLLAGMLQNVADEKAILQTIYRTFPAQQRPVTIRAGHELKGSHRAEARESIVAQAVGHLAQPVCINCARGNGHYTECVIVPGFFKGACANCRYSGKERGCKWPGNVQPTAVPAAAAPITGPAAAPATPIAAPVAPIAAPAQTQAAGPSQTPATPSAGASSFAGLGGSSSGASASENHPQPAPATAPPVTTTDSDDDSDTVVATPTPAVTRQSAAARPVATGKSLGLNAGLTSGAGANSAAVVTGGTTRPATRAKVTKKKKKKTPQKKAATHAPRTREVEEAMEEFEDVPAGERVGMMHEEKGGGDWGRIQALIALHGGDLLRQVKEDEAAAAEAEAEAEE